MITVYHSEKAPVYIIIPYGLLHSKRINSKSVNIGKKSDLPFN